ncbi:MAG: asparagine synthase-related protein [Acidobacteria bacterium]|nr:asparagine synthase-related protein [Acidobacteriota bacterium]
MTSLCAVLTAGPSPLSAMLYALAPPGTSSGQHIGLDGVSLGYVQEVGGRSSGLWTDPASGWTWAGNARLDNREELRETLHLPAGVSDAALAYHAFLRFETKALTRIQGDWQFAAWNARERKMVVARDPFGTAELYYHQSPGRFACASLINAVLTLPELSREPHWEHLVLSLSHLPCAVDSTAYRYVRRLAPGHALLLTAESCQVLAYAKIDSHVPLARGSADDHQILFEASFRQAVESRIRSVLRPATTLSGGFNSAAVTATAARLLYPAGENLVAFTVAPTLTPRLHSLAKWHANLNVRLVSASSQCPVAAWHAAVSITGSPDCHSHPPWQLPLLAEAQALGHSALLIGQGGGATLSWSARPTDLPARFDRK